VSYPSILRARNRLGFVYGGLGLGAALTSGLWNDNDTIKGDGIIKSGEIIPYHTPVTPSLWNNDATINSSGLIKQNETIPHGA